jgi:hypothetical protein
MAGLTADDGVVDGGGQQHGQQCGLWEEREARGQDNNVGGLAGCSLFIYCALATGGEGPYHPPTASATICDCRVPRLAGTHPCHGTEGQYTILAILR